MDVALAIVLVDVEHHHNSYCRFILSESKNPFTAMNRFP